MNRFEHRFYEKKISFSIYRVSYKKVQFSQNFKELARTLKIIFFKKQKYILVQLITTHLNLIVMLENSVVKQKWQINLPIITQPRIFVAQILKVDFRGRKYIVYTLGVFIIGSTFGIGKSRFDLDAYKEVISQDIFIFFLK